MREVALGETFRTRRAKFFLQQYIREGFTTVFDLGNSGNFFDVKLKAEIQNNPNFPEILVSGPGLTMDKGQFDKKTASEIVGSEYTIINKSTNIDSILQHYVDRNVDILKIYIDNDPSPGGLSIELVKQIINNPLAKNFKKITAHAIKRESIDIAIKAGIKNLEHASEFDNNDLSKINVTNTDIDAETLKEFNYYNKTLYTFQVARLERMFQKNHKILFGPDFYFDKNEKNFNRVQKIKKSIKVFQEAKISPIEILRSMTIYPAESVRMEKDIGSIKKGAYANFVVLNGDVVSSIAKINDIFAVINKGVLMFEKNKTQPGK